MKRRVRMYDDERVSKRELDVLSLLAQGISQRETAYRLGISYQTVKNHAEAAYRRMGVNTLQEWLFKKGWTKIPGYQPPPMRRRDGANVIR